MEKKNFENCKNSIINKKKVNHFYYNILGLIIIDIRD